MRLSDKFKGANVKKILILFILTPCLSWSIELTEEQAKEYNRNKLSIEVRQQSFSIFDSLVGVTSTATTTRWTAYQGFDPITEIVFFETAGYEEEAIKAQEYRNILVWLPISAGATFILSLAILPLMNFSNYNTIISVSTSLITVSGALIYAWTDFFSKNWAPYAVVEEIAGTYNDLFKKRIASGSNSK